MNLMNKENYKKVEDALSDLKSIQEKMCPIYKEIKSLKDIKKSISTIKEDDSIDQCINEIDLIIENLDNIQTSFGDSVDLLENIESDD